MTTFEKEVLTHNISAICIIILIVLMVIDVATGCTRFTLVPCMVIFAVALGSLGASFYYQKIAERERENNVRER